MGLWPCCTSGSVTIDGQVKGEIGRGYVALVGITTQDTEAQARLLAEKCVALRVFADVAGKLNLSLKDIDGEMLIISNFTLCADARHGRRPSYINAARPETALPLYHYFIDCVRELGVSKVETGVFGADMKIDLLNDGPVTIIMDSKEL